MRFFTDCLRFSLFFIHEGPSRFIILQFQNEKNDNVFIDFMMLLSETWQFIYNIGSNPFSPLLIVHLLSVAHMRSVKPEFFLY